MSTTTIRITVGARDTVRELARQTGLKQQDIVDHAVEQYRRQLLLDRANAAYASLNSNAPARENEQEERAVWDVTLADGMEDE